MRAILSGLTGFVKRILNNGNARSSVMKFVRYNNLRRVLWSKQKWKDLVVSITENLTLLRLEKLEK